MDFLEAKPFTRERPHLMTDEEYAEFRAHLTQHPEAGDAMPGAGGFRKIRWENSQRGKGKRSGSRTIYLHVALDEVIHFLAIYDHEEKDNVSPAQCKTLAAYAKAQKNAAKNRRDQRIAPPARKGIRR